MIIYHIILSLLSPWFLWCVFSLSLATSSNTHIVCVYTSEYYFSSKFILHNQCCAVLNCSVVANSLWPHGQRAWRTTVHGDSPGKNTGVGHHALLQVIFPTQGSNPGLPHCRQILYQLSHKGTPRTLEWVAYPISSGSSQPRNQTGVSCIAHGFFTKGAIRETQDILP